MTRNEILDANVIDDDSSLRPSSFDEYVGQTNLKENLKVFVGAAKRDFSLCKAGTKDCFCRVHRGGKDDDRQSD